MAESILMSASQYAAAGNHGDTDGAATMGPVRRLPPAHSEAVMSVYPVTRGRCLSGSKDMSLVLYDFEGGAVKERWRGHEKEVTKVVYGDQTQSYFSASRDKVVKLWKAGSPDPVVSFQGHDLIVTGLALNADNSQLCTGSRDNSLRLWDVDSGQCVLQNSVTRNLVTHVAWGWGADFVAQTGEDKEVRIWDTRTLTVARTFVRKQYIQNWCDVSPDNSYCVTCSNGFQGSGCEATLWDLRTDAIVHEFKGHHETVCCSVFVNSPVTGGRKLIMTSSNDCSVRLWDQNTTECLASCNIPGSGPLTSLAVYEDGRVCVSSFNTGIHVLQIVQTAEAGFSIRQLAQF